MNETATAQRSPRLTTARLVVGAGVLAALAFVSSTLTAVLVGVVVAVASGAVILLTVAIARALVGPERPESTKGA